MNHLRYLFIIFVIGLFPFYSSGQISTASNESISFLNSKELYQNAIGADSHLYTGEAYYRNGVSLNGNPFFMSDSMQRNDIFYDGTLYKNVPLLFDIVKQEVIITRFHSNEKIQLVDAKIKYFTFAGHRFENFLQETTDKNISNNIYDVIYSGKVSVLVKRLKMFKPGLAPEDPHRFVKIDKIFVRRDSNLFEIKNKNSVLDAFADKETLVKSFTRKHRFRFKKNKEKELIMTAAYYDTLIK